MTWPDRVKFFLPKIAQGLPHKVAQNPAALRAAVFSLSAKNLRGGGVAPTPPVRARVNSLDNLYGIPYKFLSISKLVRILSVVSVVVATPMRRTNQVLGGRIRSPQDESDLLVTNQDPGRQITASQNESGSHRTNHGLPWWTRDLKPDFFVFLFIFFYFCTWFWATPQKIVGQIRGVFSFGGTLVWVTSPSWPPPKPTAGSASGGTSSCGLLTCNRARDVIPRAMRSQGTLPHRQPRATQPRATRQYIYGVIIWQFCAWWCN